MATASVRVSQDFYNDAKMISQVQTRSIGQQIEHWGKIGKIAEANPDLPYHVIKSILIGLNQAEQDQLEEYNFGEGEK